MSTMLEQAIVDADALKEAAMRKAENDIIEKCSVQIKEAVDKILEQEEDELDLADLEGMEDVEGEPSLAAQEVPLAAAEGETLCPCPEAEEEIEIDFDDLERQMAAEEGELDAGEMTDREAVADEAMPEEDEDIFKAGKARAIWLGVNLVTAIIASLVIGLFEDTLQTVVALAILMPIVASMGGNAGTQSLTVVVRQLALGDIAKHDAFRTIKKEVILSLANGLLFAIIMGIIASLWFDKGMLGVVIALSMIINLLSAGFFGAMVPLLLKKMEVDPAIGSTVVLTTVTDVVGFFSFLGLATLILL